MLPPGSSWRIEVDSAGMVLVLEGLHGRATRRCGVEQVGACALNLAALSWAFETARARAEARATSMGRG